MGQEAGNVLSASASTASTLVEDTDDLLDLSPYLTDIKVASASTAAGLTESPPLGEVEENAPVLVQLLHWQKIPILRNLLLLLNIQHQLVLYLH